MTKAKDNCDAAKSEGLLLITVAEAARRLSINRGTYYRQYNSGVIGPEFIRLGRSVRVNAAELADWCAAGCPPRALWREMGRNRRSHASF